MGDQINARKFNSDFNDLDRFFTRGVNGSKGQFYRNMLRFLDKNPRYQHLRDELDLINDVRNVIVHGERDETTPVIPTDILCKKLQSILKQVKNPPKWNDIAVLKGNIFTCTEDDLISDVVQQMASNTYTHVPVVKDGVFQWLLSESIYVQWLSSIFEKEGICSTESKVLELKKYTKNSNDDYLFLPRDTDVYTIKEKFKNSIEEKKNGISKRLGVIFIANSGKETEKILGLITAWDLGKIKDI